MYYQNNKDGGGFIMKLKEIKNLVRLGIAQDMTNAYFEDIPKRREIIAVSTGTYGMNGCLFRDTESGKLYAVLSRSTLLFQIV